MGLFGELDATDIPENPFYVAPGTYTAVLSEAKVVEKKDQSGQGLSLKWTITDEDSDYYKQNVGEWFDIFPDLTSDELTPAIKSKLSRLRQRLTQMGLTAEDQDALLDDENLANLVGLEVSVEVTETPDKQDPDKIYTNVKSVSVDE